MENQGNDKTPNQPTILIVDDTPINIQVLAQSLQRHYKLLIATSGSVALELLQKSSKPDLVLLDVMMPDMDGYEVCRRIKQDSKIWNIPVIFVTAKSDVEDQQVGFNLGAADYVTKPFDIPLLNARIKVHLRLKFKSERLEQLALLDGLTDIPNRRSLEESLPRECGRSIREGTPLSMLMIDVDHFKTFNDHYGHGAGDECLRAVAMALVNALNRPGDFVSRYGGEEFAVVLTHCDERGAAQVAETLCRAVSSLNIPHAMSTVADHVTVSIGAAGRLLSVNEDGKELLNEADRALYEAKKQGRNRVVVAQ